MLSKMTGRIHNKLLMMLTTGEQDGVLGLFFFSFAMLTFLRKYVTFE